MIKFNRIGYKLGIAGAFSVLLAIGMVVNQMTSETTVKETDAVADHYQAVADGALSADVALRHFKRRARARQQRVGLRQ